MIVMEEISTKIVIYGISIAGVLVGYIWNEQGKRIARIIKKQESRPCNIICNKIGKIQTDIDWIKKMLEKKRL